MSQEGGEGSGVPENPAEDVMKQENEQLNLNPVADRSLVDDNGYHDVKAQSDYIHDELVQMVVELSFQNEYMKSQFEGLKNHILDSDRPDQQKVHNHDGLGCGDVREMRGEIESLKRELLEERQTRAAAEEALKHLRAAHLEADVKAQEFSAKLAEAQQKMDQEIQERDEKYSELDTKFNRLHKRAKQRIQELQKEKDDIEAQFHEVNGKADLASSQLSALQQELERTRQHANEALKAMDTERQQLRNTNNKLRDNIEELRHSLIPKENALEAMQQSLLEKEQMLEDMQGLLQAADEKRQVSIAELFFKATRRLIACEYLSQLLLLLHALSAPSPAFDILLFALIAEKDTKIAEMDAASSGEAARLRAAMETLKGELGHLKNEHEKEKESLEAALQSVRSKLKISEGNRLHAEVNWSQNFLCKTQLLNSKDAELGEAIEKINRVENEFASYKVRAHALLQKKDADLAAARDNDQFKALEEALKDAEREVLLISAEKDKAFQDLKEALTDSEKEISSRDAALSMAEQQIKSMQLKLESALSMHQSEKEVWDKRLQNVEEAWRLRCEALERKNAESSTQDLQREFEELKLHCKMLKEEQNSFRDLADKMMEEKDKEISRLLDENRNLQQLLDSRPSAEYYDDHSGKGIDPLSSRDNDIITTLQKQEASNSSTSAAEQQILV
ncbi:protein grip [Phtheirospermum japonicum]|uniref:Protein grip n=1 Tax=Phtheirospermum japonicum TaxID=374723 RepID=A0A830BQH1_9LAMI|nr:protein grip [Phtheirospermum japonicum]